MSGTRTTWREKVIACSVNNPNILIKMISEVGFSSDPIFSTAPRSSYTGITVTQGTPVLREVVARMNRVIC